MHIVELQRRIVKESVNAKRAVLGNLEDSRLGTWQRGDKDRGAKDDR